MVSQLRYDILFQDVDVTWYRNPLEYFLCDRVDCDSAGETFDFYVQDDGSNDLSYGPRSSNAGFYFARSNPVTRAFFQAYLAAGDLVLARGNDQVVFNSLICEHSSAYGLRIWTLSRYNDGFPSGSAYHKRKDYMKRLVAGEVKPYIFHMSWTAGKVIKVQYLQQMGDWFVRDGCIQKSAEGIMASNESPLSVLRVEVQKKDAVLMQACCLPEPEIKCHYRDKPSIIPCKESDRIDPDGVSFWD
jgi:hypothetical protein